MKKDNVKEHKDCSILDHTLTPISPIRITSKVPIERPARRIGEMLALQQVDGIDGSINNLFKGQYDDSFGDCDPATDSRCDPHLLADAMLKAEYKSMIDSKPN